MFTDLSSQMVFPLIPLFLTSVLGATAYQVGIIEGAAETTASLFKVISGYWSDKIKRRKSFVLLGYSLSSITKPLFAFASGWFFVLFVRVIERIGKGLRTAPRDAIVADSCTLETRGKAYGFHRAMDGLGSVFGALAAFFLFPIFGYKNIFLFAFLPSVVAVITILFLKEKKVAVNIQSEKNRERISLKSSFKRLPRDLKIFIGVSSVFALGHFGYVFLLLRAQNIGLADNTAILLYVLFYVVYTIFIIPAGILSDKIGRKPLLIGGYTLFAIMTFGLIFISNLYAMLLAFVLYGIFYAMIDGVQWAVVVELAPKDLKATALGAFHTAIGLVALPGGFIAGLIWDKINPEAMFVYSIVLVFVSMILFSFVRE